MQEQRVEKHQENQTEQVPKKTKYDQFWKVEGQNARKKSGFEYDAQN